MVSLYFEPVYPLSNESMWVIPEEIAEASILPPNIRRPPSMPKKKKEEKYDWIEEGSKVHMM